MDQVPTDTIPTTPEEYIVWCERKISDLEKELVKAQEEEERLQAECDVRQISIRRLKLAMNDPKAELHTPNITELDIEKNVQNRISIVRDRKKKRHELKLKKLESGFEKVYKGFCCSRGLDFPPVFILNPIATVETSFIQRFDAPRQSQLAHAQDTEEMLYPTSEEIRKKYEIFSPDTKIYGLYWFDRNWAFRNKVLPPKRAVRTGLYGTRTPHRPNPIGMASAVVLSKRYNDNIMLSGMDTLLGTPILFLRESNDKEVILSRKAKSGWMDGSLLPLYYDEGESRYTITNMSEFKEELSFLESIYPTVSTTKMVESQLTRTPFRCRRRLEKPEETTRVFGVGIFRVFYTIYPDEHKVQINSIRPGASYSSLVSLRAIDDDAERVCKFVEKFGVDKK